MFQSSLSRNIGIASLITMGAYMVACGSANSASSEKTSQSISTAPNATTAPHSENKAASDDSEIELIGLMIKNQRFSQKLLLAINGKNAKLAEFYLHELEESAEELLKVKEHDGLPIGTTAQKILIPAIEQLDKSIDSKNWVSAKDDYIMLIDSCNRCHSALEYEFIKITATADPLLFNQEF
ncbi:MAG: hypothetical protein JKX97_02070 [Candidatus Lindowbacteria bacterium]|nr:hypothetical protein [Candidatus Lindowbacteria bacterium]